MVGRKRFAALDIGSNTIRLLVADFSSGEFREVHSSQIITRLGERMHEKGTLSGEAMERTIEGIEKLLAEPNCEKPFRISAVATHAVRSAKNRKEFEELFKNRIGFGMRVISSEKEAELSLKGMEAVIKTHGPVLLFDIGGGSTEFTYKHSSGKVSSIETDLGVVRLTETFIKTAPLAYHEYRELEKHIEGKIMEARKYFTIEEDFRLVGTAGTVTSIAAMHLELAEYSPEKINNCVLTNEDVESLLEKVGKMTLEERGKIPFLKDGREDLIIPGFGIVLEVMRRFNSTELTVSDAGLREGILFSVKEGALGGTDL